MAANNDIELTKELVEKFWAGVNKDDKIFTEACWIWNNTKGKKSAGKIYLDDITDSGKSRKSYAAHRVSWVIHKGNIPEDMVVLHKLECSTKSCVNPNHLFVGNHRDCMNLMKQKKEHNVGEKHGRSKLKETDVLAIRILHAEGKKTHAQLAKQFEVNVANISFICRGETWKHVGGPRTKVNRSVQRIDMDKQKYKVKFTPSDVRIIRRRYLEGESSLQIAKEFDTTVTTVLAIANRKTHKTVTDNLEKVE